MGGEMKKTDSDREEIRFVPLGGFVFKKPQMIYIGGPHEAIPCRQKGEYTPKDFVGFPVLTTTGRSPSHSSALGCLWREILIDENGVIFHLPRKQKIDWANAIRVAVALCPSATDVRAYCPEGRIMYAGGKGFMWANFHCGIV